ncbi:MAG: hypothetical protein AXA67_04355 [Methylothermaceae bacteria B42]|nr:MAG: hypothetical protein AXA67_04355 [Methylothermaceae bacteria B42]HHJ39919.1 DUF4124 domain-containing protein [Methylothermaceae bacterium]
MLDPAFNPFLITAEAMHRSWSFLLRGRLLVKQTKNPPRLVIRKGCGETDTEKGLFPLFLPPILRMTAVLLAVGAGLGVYTANAWAEGKMYQWKDKDGNIHYSDTVPADESEHQRIIYDKSQMRRLKVVERAKTPEELAREMRLAQLRREEKKLLDEQLARDRALLRTYRNEEDLELALKGQLNTIDARIKVLSANIKRQYALLDAHIKKAADIERKGKKPPKSLIENIQATRRQIQQHQLKIAHENKAKELVRQKYAKDLQRFRRLMKQMQKGIKKTATTRPDTEPSSKQRVILSVVHCTENHDCGRAWQLARIYLKMHSSTPLYIDSENILHAHDPIKEDDIALTVARIHNDKYDTLFLDVRCKLSTIGEEVCKSPKVREIRAGFVHFIREGLRSTAQ